MATPNSVFDEFLTDYARVFRYMNEKITGPLSAYHLTFDTFIIMHEIGTSSQPPLLMDIAHAHRVSRSAISRQISILLKYHYVYQESNPNDRRQKSLRLTDQGQSIDRDLMQNLQVIFQEWVDQLGKRRVNTLLAVLGDFNRKIITPNYEQTNKLQ
ncbi:MarR family winged helix-turn-helix transcriptional regulator [Lactiplantibacillus modestisalitolerans]|uniref:MarR family winged helix-turn-helix transcriptional regulator n=1 Tax=Lactiplantibacillus modestisalitolerans TaxID=1457219 RepID=A0ABV5WXN8_9LACO|nr:winged helix DNA-binding protein [Lactiplantibacillus modestisalitolerans]